MASHRSISRAPPTSSRSSRCFSRRAPTSTKPTRTSYHHCWLPPPPVLSMFASTSSHEPSVRRTSALSLSLSLCLSVLPLTHCVCPSRTAGDTAQVDNKKSTPLLYIAGASGLSLNPTLQQKILTVLQEKGSSINAANIVRRAHSRGDRRIPTDTLLLTLTPMRRATERRDAVAPRRW